MSEFPVWLALVVAAPFIGSFIGVVAIRFADGRPILLGRSECDNCHQKLNWIELVPLISWLWLRGRCRACGATLGVFFPLVEIAAVVPVVWAMAVVPNVLLPVSAFFAWILLTLALIDWRIHRLPDPITLLLLATGLAAAFFFDRDRWLDHLIGALVGFAVFALIASLYRAIRKRDGLGLGDAKMLAGLGAWLGWEGLPSTIFLAAILALVLALLRALRTRNLALQERLAFGPFLALGGWIVWLYGPLMLF